MPKSNNYSAFTYRVCKKFTDILQKTDSGLFGPDSSLIVDRQTGVTYLIVRSTFGSGITPLLNADGKVVITKAEDIISADTVKE